MMSWLVRIVVAGDLISIRHQSAPASASALHTRHLLQNRPTLGRMRKTYYVVTFFLVAAILALVSNFYCFPMRIGTHASQNIVSTKRVDWHVLTFYLTTPILTCHT
jgi:hypothetical protein